MINIRQTPARDLPPLPDSGYDLTPPGQVRLAPGDVLRLPQGGDVMVVRVSLSNATVRPLAATERTITPRFGDPVTVTSAGRQATISCCIERDAVLERRGADGLARFLAGKHKQPAGEATGTAAQQTTNESESDMAKKKAVKSNKGRARGGLAADALAAQGNGDPKPKRGRAANGEAVATVPAKGRAKFVGELLDQGKSASEITEATIAAYPKTTAALVEKIIKRKEAKAAKKEAAEAKA